LGAFIALIGVLFAAALALLPFSALQAALAKIAAAASMT
jgi:hypothetical protein